MKNKLYILIAPQCSGKSTWIRDNKNIPNLFIVSTDDMIRNKYPDLSYNEAYKKVDFKKETNKMKKLFLEAVNDKKNIIVDRMNLTIKGRKYFLDNVSNDYEKIGIVFSWDEETFIKRNEKRSIEEGKNIPLKLWRNTCTQYSIPLLNEGFDKIDFLPLK